MMRKVTMVCDLQFGSTGKGLIVGYLAEKLQPDAVVTAWMPNAGHTYINSDGQVFIHTMLANAVVSPKLKKVFIGPGSMINPGNLLREINSCKNFLEDVEILIHPHAGVVTEANVNDENALITIGSTQKGCSRAIVSKIGRNPFQPAVAISMLTTTDLEKYVVTIQEYNDSLDSCKNILVEGAQGFSLSIHHGFYPYTTSRDVTPAQIMADCGIPHKWLTKVIGCLRIHPIRVANRYNSDGKMVGYSGPTYEDSKEISWEDIGVAPEKTTVTKLDRRVFSFSKQQLQEACRMCCPNELFVNFVNYVKDPTKLSTLLEDIRDIAFHHGNGVIRYIGDGPTKDNVIDTYHEPISRIFKRKGTKY